MCGASAARRRRLCYGNAACAARQRRLCYGNAACAAAGAGRDSVRALRHHASQSVPCCLPRRRTLRCRTRVGRPIACLLLQRRARSRYTSRQALAWRAGRLIA
jgi:hypothetical protein